MTDKKRKVGRPTKLNPQTQKKICDAIAIGATYQAAAEYAGIAYSTFNVWINGTDAQFMKFSEAISEANARGQISNLETIKTASKRDWRAAAWVLERRHSDSYGNKISAEHIVKGEIELFNYAAVDRLIATRPAGDSSEPEPDQGSNGGS